MAKKKKTLTFTDEHIALISNLKFEKFIFDDKEHYAHFKNMVSDLKLSDNPDYDKYNQSILNELYSFNPHYRFGWGCDQYSLFGGTYVLEDIAMILGHFDKAIENSENLATGRRFPEELEEQMYEYYEYICENLDDILTLMLSFIGNGGLTAGTYEYSNHIWKRKEEKKTKKEAK